jgi:hypothetical protein
MDLMLDADCTDEEQDQETEEVDEYRNRVRDIKLLISSLLYPTQHPGSRSGSPAASEFENAGSASTTTRKRNFKLPKIELKKFNGELKEWLGFWSQFQKIDEDDTLHVTDKFQYLIQALVPGTEPNELVSSFSQTAGNYPQAVEALKKRFGRESLLIQVYVREFKIGISQRHRQGEDSRCQNVYAAEVAFTCSGFPQFGYSRSIYMAVPTC